MSAALATAAAMLAVSAAPAAADHSWGGYHWARTSNPFTVQLGDNVSSAWDSQLRAAATNWSANTASNPLNASVSTGASGGRKCPAALGRVEVCNYEYGRNRWLGVASVWASGGHIVQATVKMNDTYFAMTKYNTNTWRQSVMCQEVGHTFGLDHQDESGADFHTCMDYASNPDADNTLPNYHDYEMLAQIYAHLDSTTTIGAVATGSGRGLRRLDDDLWVENVGQGEKRFVHVYWVDPRQAHQHAPAGA